MIVGGPSSESESSAACQCCIPLSVIYCKGSSTTHFDMFNSEEIQSSFNSKSRGTDYETANYPPEHDCTDLILFPLPLLRSSLSSIATSSGGSGSPEDAWSKSAQRGKHFPAHLTGLPPNSTSSTTVIYSPDPYTPSNPFTPLNSSGLPITSPSTPIPTVSTTAPSDFGSDPDSWESRNEALKRLNQRYRDSIDAKDI